ncbi:Aldo/keto reductase [Pholiota conissans]|uniref:Aldo/keto reductase n=1 Tax=Pholiota conissans TaxID=109636 RepID=A0A9P5YNI9_9AGAR|nr:Aldo/keto reductase [Pholiota conissans]
MVSPKLLTRKIGTDDVTAIGFGLMGLSIFYGQTPMSDEERFKVLDAAVEMGCTNWDTSDVYGDNEDLIGRWFKYSGKRDQIFLATKFGGTPTGFNNKPEYIKTAISRSLERLGVDTVDLYYVHRVDKVVPIEITIRTLAELVKEGKIRYIGLSEVSSATIRRAHAVHPIAAVQVEYSPFFLDIEDEKIGVLKTCRELGIAVVAYSPNGRGMLAGKFKSFDDIPEGDSRKLTPRFGPANFPNIMKIVNGFEELGAKLNATPAQVCLAWLLAQGDDIIPIPGTKQIKYLQENLGALDIKLSDEEVKEVREIVDKADANHGDRYHIPILMDFCFADTPELVE